MKSRKEVSLQKGSLLVLVAVLLPILFACARLARDLGSIYSYKSNLQNAVDSAALVGASAYMRMMRLQEAIRRQTAGRMIT